MSEEKYIAEYNIKDYDCPLTTVDIVCLAKVDNKVQVLLTNRNRYPYKDMLSLPGGFIQLNVDTDIETAAHREISEKTNLHTSYIEQVVTIGNHERDPRGWSLTTVYLALMTEEEHASQKGKEDENCVWVAIEDIQNLKLAFDHNSLIDIAFERLQSKSKYTSLPLHLLHSEFTLTEAQTIFEIILEKTLEKKSFRRRLLGADIIQDTGKEAATGARKAATFRLQEEYMAHFFPRILGN